jgi:hypothetical protein
MVVQRWRLRAAVPTARRRFVVRRANDLDDDARPDECGTTAAPGTAVEDRGHEGQPRLPLIPGANHSGHTW